MNTSLFSCAYHLIALEEGQSNPLRSIVFRNIPVSSHTVISSFKKAIKDLMQMGISSLIMIISS